MRCSRSHASAIVALDFLFWNIYGSTDPGWRERALEAGLGELERARQAGAWVIIGDVPHVVTAAEWMLPRSQVPDTAALAALNAKIVAWAGDRERVLFVPFAAWAEPLAAGGEIEHRARGDGAGADPGRPRWPARRTRSACGCCCTASIS